MLLHDLDAFFAEHDRCGEWDNHSPEDGSRVVVTCWCGATFSRIVEQNEGQEEGR